MLSFKPNLFFNELERIDRKTKFRKEAMKTSFYRAVDKGYLQYDAAGFPQLTDAGKKQLEIFKPKRLSGDAKLLLIFDIPEQKKYKRDSLRRLLRELKFKQVQKSVWMSSYDSRNILERELHDQHIYEYVDIFEAQKLSFKK